MNGHVISSLLDSASDASFIAEQLAKELGLDIIQLEKREAFRVIGGGIVYPDAFVEITLNVDGKVFKNKVLVCPKLRSIADILLGGDSLRLAGIDILYSKNMVQTADRQIPFEECVRHPTIIDDQRDDQIHCALVAAQAVSLSPPIERWADRDVLLPPVQVSRTTTNLVESVDENVVKMDPKVLESYHRVKELGLLVDDVNWQETVQIGLDSSR